MTILYYTWFENSEHDIYETFKALGHSISRIHLSLDNYNNDDNFFCEFQKVLRSDSYDCIFTFNFFPIISDIAETNQIPYICWIYDNPHYTLYSKSVKNTYNYIFSFDYNQYLQLQAEKLPHNYHMPLAVNTTRLNSMLGSSPWQNKFHYEISFVGSLYESNLYQQLNQKPDYLKGYINGLITSQTLIYGYNFVYELLTDDILFSLEQLIPFDFGSNYSVNKRAIYSDILNAELTHRERVQILSRLSDKFDLSLFTASDKSLVPKADYGGFISYLNVMPEIFAKTKININLTLRSITSGIPLRALDIMGAGGFLLSNYQSELMEYFCDGKELVLFDCEEELMEKASYYLNHEQERKLIAAKGWERVQKDFSYSTQLEKILEIFLTG